MLEERLGSDHVRIRMYRQGLGDCFLLTIPDGAARAHILIDCGVLKGTDDAEARMTRVAENILATTARKLDLLIVTHEHWDHLSGFLQAEQVFADLSIAETWLAWTESPSDETASELRNRRTRATGAVASAADRLRESKSMAARASASRLDGLLEFYGESFGVAGRKTTAKAMEWVKGREGAVRRYLYPGNGPLDLPRVTTARAYVLGPPVSQSLLRRSNPSKRNSEVYEMGGEGGSDLGFFAAVDQAAGMAAQLSPFEKWFSLGKEDSLKHKVLAEAYWKAEEWRQIEDNWLEAADQLALKLDSDTNNTSLVLAFELPSSRRVLLFPGDAQVGNWLSWEPLKWSVQHGQATTTVTTADLLARTVFYKVGHHGSHNATLRDKGLELMSSDELTGMIPVSRQKASNMGWQMPFSSLFNRLLEKTKGRLIDADNGIPAAKPAALSQAQWLDFLGHTEETKDWVDYWVKM